MEAAGILRDASGFRVSMLFSGRLTLSLPFAKDSVNNHSADFPVQPAPARRNASLAGKRPLCLSDAEKRFP